MSSNQQNQFPGGSKGRVNRAGDNIRNDTPTAEDLKVIEDWRAGHRQVLNTFQATLRNRIKKLNKSIVFAQRHKRKNTIFNKLSRFPKMQLSRMDDVAGCRMIFSSTKDLYAFRNNFLQAQFKHQCRNEIDKYDYIKSPKSTGYRGVHDVYSYDVSSPEGKHLKGLLVEIQYRTQVQHAWATAVEVVGVLTDNQPKFEEGDKRYLNVMALASELLSRYYENEKGPHPQFDNNQLVKKFREGEENIGLLNKLQNLNPSTLESINTKNVILSFSPNGEAEVLSFRYAPEAVKKLFDLEGQNPEGDVVLVRAGTPAELRLAFKNYFSDAKEFISFIDKACSELGS